MHLPQHPELLDRLAASYALGTLRAGARRRFETLAREQAPVRAAALIWQSRLGSVAELQQQAAPAAAVWTRIDNLLRAEQEQQAMLNARVPVTTPADPGGWLRNLLLWRGATFAGVATAAVAVVVGLNQQQHLTGQIASLQTQIQAAPQIEYVAVLQDNAAAASMLVTFDPKNHKLVLQRVGGFQEAGDKSLQLWALPPAGSPRSLGVLGRDKLLQLTAGEGDVKEIPTLAISLEPKGGVPGQGGPTGPVLFKGALIQKVI
ncbi:MAG: anti-sigma factor [Burkholderiales bacterium]|nr:anti-sigma factor [Burkholderiales bacterium]